MVTNEEVAIKVEKVDSKKQVLKQEVAVLKKLQPSEYVVPFITCGRHGDFNYLVMELLGENISELRRRQSSGRFSLVTTCRLATQMIAAIEAIHKLGYLHRDIKPSNFAVGLSSVHKGKVYMIDFGLSRRYLLPNGKVSVREGSEVGSEKKRGEKREKRRERREKRRERREKRRERKRRERRERKRREEKENDLCSYVYISVFVCLSVLLSRS